MGQKRKNSWKGGTYPFGEKALIGVIHLKPLPGSPAYDGDLDGISAAAIRDASILCDGGMDGLLLENFGDVPFHKNRVEPHTGALMAVVLREIRGQTRLPLGVNVLRNDGRTGLGVALAAGAEFIRVNVFTGASVTDQGLIQGDAHGLLRYRRSIESRTALFADVHVKHGRPLAPGSIEDAAQDAWFRGCADGLVITGQATGAPIDLHDLEAVRDALPEARILAGSGVTEDNVREIFRLADGAIVGTSLKEGGDVTAPVDPARVTRLVKAVRALS